MSAQTIPWLQPQSVNNSLTTTTTRLPPRVLQQASPNAQRQYPSRKYAHRKAHPNLYPSLIFKRDFWSATRRDFRSTKNTFYTCHQLFFFFAFALCGTTNHRNYCDTTNYFFVLFRQGKWRQKLHAMWGRGNWALGLPFTSTGKMRSSRMSIILRFHSWPKSPPVWKVTRKRLAAHPSSAFFFDYSHFTPTLSTPPK